jgi:hypothetical protein
MSISCSKKADNTTPSNEFSASFSAGGKKYTIIPSLDQCVVGNLNCMFFNNMGGIVNTERSGLTLKLYTEYANTANNGISLSLKLYGEDIGKYDGPTTFCNDFKMYTSLIQSSNGANVAIVKEGSYIEITQKKKNVISGNFRLKIDYDASFLKDSIVTGEFKNLTYNE